MLHQVCHSWEELNKGESTNCVNGLQPKNLKIETKINCQGDFLK